MHANDLSALRFAAYIETIGSVIGHADRVEPLRAYCTGLLLPGDRKSVEPMAALIDPARVRSRHQSMHHFVANAGWSDRRVLAAIRQYALPMLEVLDPIEAWIVDDTGFPKKGTHSVGVARQYCGQLGKQDNCQVAVSVSVANAHASLPVAYRLYVPNEWANDAARRSTAGIPDDVTFETKPRIALDQIQRLLAEDVPRGIVLADAAYGNDTKFREGLTALKMIYAVGVQSTTTVWPHGNGPIEPPPKSAVKPAGGRPRTLLRRDAGHQPVPVEQLARDVGRDGFKRVRWREGSDKTLESRFFATRIRVAHRDHWRSKPHAEEWLLIEWPVKAEQATKYWLSTLPEDTSLRRLVHVAKMRWRIERDYEELKSEIGLGHYEGRGWRGFHHHATLCIAAYAFLVAERGLSPPEAEPRRSTLGKSELPKDYRPRGSPVPG